MIALVFVILKRSLQWRGEFHLYFGRVPEFLLVNSAAKRFSMVASFEGKFLFCFLYWCFHWPYLVVQVYELITCVRRANENAGNLISVVQFLICIYIYIYIYIYISGWKRFWKRVYIYIYLFIYYMASSASGQYAGNSVFWLATRAGKMERYCPPGIARFVPANKISPKFKRVHERFLSQTDISVTVKRFSVIYLSGWN